MLYLPLAIRFQNEGALLCANQHPYTAHVLVSFDSLAG